MNVKPIIVKEYLDSLKEDGQLDMIFPLLLESCGFEILSKPTISKGLSQYGKDIVAVGKDMETGKKKRFYFELKGGEDRNITNYIFTKKDGVRESIIESKIKKFNTTFPNFEKLPLEIVLVHNGELRENTRPLMSDFIEDEFPKGGFDRWDIQRLTKYFTERLFGVYLLADYQSSKLFNKTLINLDTTDDVSNDFNELINLVLKQQIWEGRLSREWKHAFVSLKLISFILYSQSKEYDNLNIAKKHLTHLTLIFWSWILKNKLEENKKVISYFDSIQSFLFNRILPEYIDKIAPALVHKDGLFWDNLARYEEVGYTYRTLDFLQYFCSWLSYHKESQDFDEGLYLGIFKRILQNHEVSARALIDINSITIIDIINLLLELGDTESAQTYMSRCFFYIKTRKQFHDILPDTSNSMENVIRAVTSSKKSIFYSDSTSPLLNVLLEYSVILDMANLYAAMRDFVLKYKIDLGIFVPHHGKNSHTKDMIEDIENDLEEQLFSKPVEDGYQSGLLLVSRGEMPNLNTMKPLSFKDFKAKLGKRKSEFEYDYRTIKSGFKHLLPLAHYYFKTPYFPDKWRSLIE